MRSTNLPAPSFFQVEDQWSLSIAIHWRASQAIEETEMIVRANWIARMLAESCRLRGQLQLLASCGLLGRSGHYYRVKPKLLGFLNYLCDLLKISCFEVYATSWPSLRGAADWRRASHPRRIPTCQSASSSFGLKRPDSRMRLVESCLFLYAPFSVKMAENQSGDKPYWIKWEIKKNFAY